MYIYNHYNKKPDMYIFKYPFVKHCNANPLPIIYIDLYAAYMYCRLYIYEWGIPSMSGVYPLLFASIIAHRTPII